MEAQDEREKLRTAALDRSNAGRTSSEQDKDAQAAIMGSMIDDDLAEILKRLGLAVPDEADDITDDFDENGSVNGEPDAEYGGNP